MGRIKDVAVLGGVSVASVSRYINSPEKLRPETQKKVRDAIEKLQYRPSELARNLRTKKTKSLAVIIPSLANMYYIDLFDKLNDSSSAAGYTINLLSTNHDRRLLIKYLQNLHAQCISGVIICFLDDDEVLEGLRAAQDNFPIVLITTNSNRKDFNSVFIDTMEGEIQATQHLINLGCKNIAFVGGQRNTITLGKYEGFEVAMRKNELLVDLDFCFFGINHFSTGFKAVQHFLATGKRFDGIVCANDDIAIGCVKYLIRSGFKIPEDVKVIGHNGIPLIYAIEPSISSLGHPMQTMTNEALLMLREQIENTASPLNPRHVTLYASLIVNSSTDGTETLEDWLSVIPEI